MAKKQQTRLGRGRRGLGYVDAHVGARLREYRLRAGLSQESLGARVGVTFQQIQKYEKGANRVGSSRLSKIAGILKVPISHFFDNSAAGSDGPVAGPVVTDLLISPYAVQMLKAFAKLPSDKLRRSIVVLTESIAKSPEV